MNDGEKLVAPLSLFPPIGLFVAMAKGYQIIFDLGENYTKQTIRNRYHILGANGVQSLTVNVVGQKGLKIPSALVKIDYEKNWVRIHKRAIESAYRSSPFFEHYYPKISSLFDTELDTLGSFFKRSMPLWCDLLNIKNEFQISTEFIKSDCSLDLRPPIKSPGQFPLDFNYKPYLQVFSDRFDFIPNLSIIDLLFNEGPAACSILNA